MNEEKLNSVPMPVVNKKEQEALDSLTKRYNKLIEPGKIAQFTKKASGLIPIKVKEWTKDLGVSISEQELYLQVMDIVGKGFKTLEELAAKTTISEKQILDRINKTSKTNISSIEEICFVRSYNLAKTVNRYKWQDIIAAAVEGASTGYVGFWGLPFNIALSSFLYFRAVQSIAMFYGYDVKNDTAELIIAGDVFTYALNPNANNDEMATIIGKVMVMGQAEMLKQVSKKSWEEMATRGGIPLLLTRIRALANKTAKKALEKAEKKGLESSVFREVLEQIGKKATKKTIQKSIPYFSAAFSALIDTAQMNKVLEFADIFYQKRFILEKESKIAMLIDERNAFGKEV